MTKCGNSGGGGGLQQKHANRHISAFLDLDDHKDREGVDSPIQIVTNGRELTVEALLSGDTLDFSRPILVKDTPESIGMKVFKPASTTDNQKQQYHDDDKESVSVRDIADVLGHDYPIRVIDVEHQEELQGWTLADLVEVFEDKRRLVDKSLTDDQMATPEDIGLLPGQRAKRKAAQRAFNDIAFHQTQQKALNQLSLEFSKTALQKHVLSPAFVRELDWIDQAWPSHLKERKQSYPSVQYYCLTSTEGAYTDFHVDFGGTAVWYHVLSGSKTFCLIPPTAQNLKIYEEWIGYSDQELIFLPNLILNDNEVIRLSLEASQTLVIPTGWIHAVYTPQDSVVIGGNFLHGLDIALQLQIHEIEERTRVPGKFRFPFFHQLHFYAGGMYLKRLRNNQLTSFRELRGISGLIRVLKEWSKDIPNNNLLREAALYAASTNACQTVDEFLQALVAAFNKVSSEGGPQWFSSPSPPHIDASSATLTGKPRITGSGSPGAPRLRLKLGKLGVDKHNQQSTPTKVDEDRDDDPFRIVVSIGAQQAYAPPPPIRSSQKLRSREDTEFVDHGVDDDDWVPSHSHRKKPAKRNIPTERNAPALNKMDRRIDQVGSPSSSTLQAQKSKKPKTTARQRLMKRFR